MRRIDDGKARQPGIATQRGSPGDRAAPVVSDERELVEAQPVSKGEDIVDQRIGLVITGDPEGDPTRRTRARQA